MALSLSHISFTYEGAPEPLFDDVSATFPRGWSAILGDNGIGKSTLANIAVGRLTPDQGKVSPSPRGLVVGYCPQRTVETPERLEDFAADWSPEAMTVRETLGIDDEWCYRYDTLSGGEAKRVQVACALAARPDVLVLDEPTNHVDGPTRNSIARVMRTFRGIGIVISHDVALIDATCDRCVCFERRHIRGRNVTQVGAYAGGYSRMIQARRERERSEADALSAAHRETARLVDIQTTRHTKVQQVESAKRQGGGSIPKTMTRAPPANWRVPPAWTPAWGAPIPNSMGASPRPAPKRRI
ncbi:ABC transporter ATP-binding protein [Bifidobacterium lemurum]|uniref:ABC transporter ATP-binding protein n=1 Tax=Bifidobacterium lemurum TaxID=1603886 RepID=A0A261FT57_9BIFI|nr:ATP-binding cassette domain-containing protein [Bifidobacterium lemurum]OZG62339.1 ABC transporter ATP-binding protein [Bifidobacterium lemurum]QOL33699.1 ABC-F family ATP-binding cassette domain-containing protein [Bifidobacterium lemurum]